jgi:hypothetical protein
MGLDLEPSSNLLGEYKGSTARGDSASSNYQRISTFPSLLFILLDISVLLLLPRAPPLLYF